jgi:hypothetical protein
MKNFVPIIRFGFDDSNKSQYDLRIMDSFGPRTLQELIPERRVELCDLLRKAAEQIESGWLSAPAKTMEGEQHPPTTAGMPLETAAVR